MIATPLKLFQPKLTDFQLLKNLVRTMANEHQHFLTLDNINPNIRKMEYPICETLVTRAVKLEKELKDDLKKPFKEIIRADIGDCHAMGHAPITFIRQVMSLVVYPQLFDGPGFPEDAKDRARTILDGCRGSSIGSYTEATGIEIIRKHVAEYIANRDGIPSNWENITLFGGASDGIKKILKLFVKETNGKKTGVMIPIPQNPLYFTALDELGLHQIRYYLDESQNWKISTEEMQKSVNEAKKVCIPKVLLIINPGNPSGQILTRESIEEIIQFAYKENLYLLVDEIYQANIHVTDLKFLSFKKVMIEMGEPYANMELASFMSCSKGYMGECGFRSGFAEIINMCPKVRAMFYKANTAMLCPPATAQGCLEAVVRPPKKGESSYKQYCKEKEDILNSLKMQAKVIVKTLNSFEGITCNEVQGGMYAFPQLRFSSKAIQAANKLNQSPDQFYASEVLENTGICIVPGEQFGQAPGTYHFCVTTLLPIDKMMIMLENLQVFHNDFMDRYR